MMALVNNYDTSKKQRLLKMNVPIMPPTSKSVDRSAALFGSTSAATISKDRHGYILTAVT